MKKPGLFVRAIERVILARPRREMRRKAGKKIRAGLGALEKCIETRKKLAHYNVPEALRLYDSAQFCLMYDADLTVLSRDMTCTTNWWETRLYGRLLAMTMLECVEDIPAVLGKNFRESVAALVSDAAHLRRLSEITKSLSDFRRRHEKNLRQVRTIAAAHRDHNAALQISVIENLDIRKLMRMAGELNDLLGAFVRAMTEILLQMNVVGEILKSFSKKPRKACQ
jgi:hypothetical protein